MFYSFTRYKISTPPTSLQRSVIQETASAFQATGLEAAAAAAPTAAVAGGKSNRQALIGMARPAFATVYKMPRVLWKIHK